MTADLLSLAARLEQAPEGSRELDALIRAATTKEPRAEEQIERMRRELGREPSDQAKAFWRNAPPPIVPAYTTSVDASLLLVKQVSGANCHGYDMTPRGCDAYVSRNHVKDGHWLVEARAATAPLAIVAACLRALAARLEQE